MKILFYKTLITCIVILLMIPPHQSYAQSSIEQKCEYTPLAGVNPSYQTINCLLTEMALEYNIPPEVVKAVAAKESGPWKQFDDKGEAIETKDGGIGLMQVTLYQDYNIDSLKTDILYNIRAGVEMLDFMFTRNDLPTIGTHSRDVIEHWYFAIMAYNGIKPVNSPIVSETGERNPEAYQEEVFQIIEDNSLLQLTSLSFESSYFDYDPDSTENIKFIKRQYPVTKPMHFSKHLFEKEELVFATNSVSLRERATTESNRLGYLQKNEEVKITGEFVYDQSIANKPNHFVWYPIERQDGTTGYVAASYLEQRPSTPVINEVKDQDNAITGTGQPGNIITLKYNNTILGTTEVQEDGTFALIISPLEADTVLTLFSEDKAGNKSEDVSITVQPSTSEEKINDLFTIVQTAKENDPGLSEMLEQYGIRK